MKDKTSKIIFFIAVLAFFISTPIIVFYARGYKIDWKNFKIIQTGAIFASSTAKNAEIYINHQYQGLSPRLVKSLKPNDYLVELKLSGYQPWYKTLAVYPSTVTEIKSVFLAPINISSQLIITQNSILNYWISPDWEKYIFLNQDNDLQLYDQNIDQQYPINATTTLDASISWSENSDKALIQDFNNAYILNVLDKQIFRIAPTTTLQQISLHPAENNKVLFLSNDILYEFDYSRNSTNQILDKEIAAYQIVGNQIYYLMKSNNILYRYDLGKKENVQITVVSFEPTSNDLKLIIQNSHISIINNHKLYILNEKERKFIYIDENVSSIDIALDGNILVQKGQEIFVYYPNNQNGDKQFITRYSQKISNAQWFNNQNNIIFSLDNEIKITETDTRNHLNIFNIANFNMASAVKLNSETFELYFLNNQGLNKIRLIP